MRKVRTFCVILSVMLLISCKSAPLMPVHTVTSAPMVTPTPLPTLTVQTPPADSLQQIVDGLSNRALIGQMAMIGFDGTTEPSAAVIQLMKDYGVGNIILFGWNIETFEQAKALVDLLTAHNPLPKFPLLIATDVEGGLVTRFHWRPLTNSAYVLGKAGDANAVYAQYKRIGEGLRGCGITVDLAPVMDIAATLEGTFLGRDRRMFGTDAQKVGLLCAAAVRGLHDGGVLSFGKHFPGHGNTAIDSHAELPIIPTTLIDWNRFERKPFEASIKQGLDGILVGHMSYPNIDKSISSLSKVFVSELLRKDMGFGGIIMSDDLRMQAVTSQYSVGEAAVRFIEAGGDLVLIGRYQSKQESVLNALFNALQSGRLSRERCEQSVYRILKAKQSLTR